MKPLFRKTDDKAECLLCPHFCKIAYGKTGICGVRKNTGERIELITYGVISGYALDPVEKKPLYHFFPGHNVLSIGSYGCNMRCDFCQNYTISQVVPENITVEITAEKIVSTALLAEKNVGLAFTYNEPVVWFEFLTETARFAKENNLFTIMVSNGYVNSEPLDEIIQFIDAFNIDLKAFNSTFYRKLTGADIEPVKSCLKQIADSGRHLEITTLIIPGYNDNEREMAQQSEWIAGELGKDVPLHLSRYFPKYKRNDPATSQDVLNRLHEIARKNLDHVYLGNSDSESGQNTVCPKCRTIVTIRSGYHTRLVNIDTNGGCTNCKTLIYKYFTPLSTKS